MQIKGWLLGAGLCGLFVACSGTTTPADSSGANAGTSSAGRTSVGGAGAGTSAGAAHDGGSTSRGAASSGTSNSGGSVSIGGSTASVAGNESSGGGDPSNVAGAANDSDVPPCVVSTFAQTCGSSVCHAGNASAGVDLISPGVASRLVNQPAQHPGAELGAGCPIGDKLIDTTNRSASWLLIKLQGTEGTCGLSMPPSLSLNPTQTSCLVDWINTVQPNGT